MKILQRGLLGLILLVLLILQLWCTYITFNFPYNGIYVEVKQVQQGDAGIVQTSYIVNRMEANGRNVEVHEGDVILQINGGPPGEWSTVKSWNVVEKARTLLILRNGQEQFIQLTKGRPSAVDLIPLFEEVVCVFMCGLLLIKERRSPSARLLAYAFLSAALIFLSLGASNRGDTIGKLLIASGMMMLPIVFLHFLVVFFKEKGDMELPRRLFKYLYGIALAAIALRSLYFFPSMAYIYRFDGSLTIAFFIVVITLNIVLLSALFVKVWRVQSQLSTIIKSVFFSLLISFLPIITLSFLPQLLADEWIFDPMYTSCLLLIFPITFAYLIASNQLYDIGLVVRRFLFAAVMSVAPVAVFTAIFGMLFHAETNPRQIATLFIGLIILMSTMLYAAEYWTTRLEPYLFPRKFMLKLALKKISKNLGSISSFRELKDIILVDIVNTLGVMGVAILIRSKDGTEIISAGEMDHAELEMLMARGALRNHVYYTVMEINDHEDYSSYLVVTSKKTNTRIGNEERNWLQLITSYLEVGLENVYLIRKLTGKLQQMVWEVPQEENLWLSKVMFELQEEERIRIATDLHDTTMQDLFFLKRRLSSLADKPTIGQEDREQINSMNNFVEMINASLRQSCFELNPHLLKEVGLKQTLKSFIEKEKYSTPFELTLQMGSLLQIEEKDLPSKRHIFRIVQELLNNAKKHSQASEVIFHLREDRQSFYLHYEDDGVGFPTDQEAKLEIGGSGMGLANMRSRVLHVGGKFEMNSSEGNGTKITITIPIDEVLTT
ncbi:ATP-binding protein [Paenibacillus ferrarius]|uniref:ATP-binding protein n=1 Tax=Paenibacillus ferrarius TaxID=1469647 RepID=UPI003D2ACD3F